jgi:hypothetical protein
MTTALPVASASRIFGDPGHLILLAVVILAGVGYVLYRRNRTRRYNSSHKDEENR